MNSLNTYIIGEFAKYLIPCNADIPNMIKRDLEEIIQKRIFKWKGNF